MNLVENAVSKAEHQRRRAVDWRAWQDQLENHRIYFGGHRMDYDECCRIWVYDQRLSAFSELAIVGPYLKALQKVQEAQVFVPHVHLLDRHPPQYFDGRLWEEDKLVYVDLDAAYWSIYSRATLDVAYDGVHAPRNGGVHFLDAADLRPYKLARNALMGMLHRMRRSGAEYGRYFVEDVPESSRRPDLWGLVMDVLECVAWEARELGCFYLHTDGFIFARDDAVSEFVDRVDRNWGLSASVREQGPGYVWGMGRWRIGETLAGPKHFTISDARRTMDPRYQGVDSMMPVEPSTWLALHEFMVYSNSYAEKP